ncbi:MAG: ankyrin repeat domain-containing protein [Cyanobacteria bacterium J06639_16]
MRQLQTQWKGLIGAGLLVIATGTLIYHFRSTNPSRANQESADSTLVAETQAIDFLKDYSHLSRAGLVPRGFLVAIDHGDQETVEIYLQRGIDPNMTFCNVYLEGLEKAPEVAADCDTSTPLLHYLTTFPNIINPAMMDLLIEYGADVNIQNDSGETLLHVLATQLPLPKGRASEVGARLIANGADIDARDRQGKSVLETALCKGSASPDFVNHLIDSGADLEAIEPTSNSCGIPLLHMAAWVNHPVLTEFALAQGIEVNARNQNGQTPLHYLSGPAAGEILLANGADLNAKDGSGRTPLEFTICGSNPLKSELIAWFLAHGANTQTLALEINCVKSHQALFAYAQRTHTYGLSSYQSSLMEKAIGADSVELAQLSIAKGSDITLRDREGRTALHHAGRFNSPNVATLFLAEGADINAVDDDGYTPLHIAAIHRNLDTAQLLIEQGADVNAVDEDGHTPLYEAENLAWDPEFRDIYPETRQAVVDLLQRSGGEQ